MIGDDLQDLIGSDRDIYINDGEKRCKICDKRISMYNPNDYCFVHVFKGVHKEKEEDDRKKRRAAKIARTSKLNNLQK